MNNYINQLDILLERAYSTNDDLTSMKTIIDRTISITKKLPKLSQNYKKVELQEELYESLLFLKETTEKALKYAEKSSTMIDRLNTDFAHEKYSGIIKDGL